tara:strand:+ start:1529 stop:2863 length:1335 start_codon:yes stop_codon:yes gene_type:complete
MIEYLIVGSGFTASVICIHLIDTGINPKKITVIGPTKLGQGNAFNCPNDQYRLNVRSEIMWIYPEKKSEFTNWAKKEIIDNDALHSAGNFYKRSDFGRFIYSKLRKYLESGELCHEKEVIEKIHKNNDGSWVSILSNEKELHSKNIILATGNPSPQWPFPLKRETLIKTESLIENPWDGQWIKKLKKNDNISIIGSGLTALDCLASLKSYNHDGEINIVSPSGNFPPPQALWTRKNTPIWPNGNEENLLPSKFLNFMKNYLPSEPLESSKWQSAWEELRIDISHNWNKLPNKGKFALKKKLNSTWSRLRYRASPQSINALKELKNKQQLIIFNGYAKNIIQKKNSFSLLLNNGKSINSDIIINCSGKGKDNLNEQLINSKIGVPDIFNEALEVDENHRVLSTDRNPNIGLYMISPVLIAKFGDIVAANRLALQSMHLASIISSN